LFFIFLALNFHFLFLIFDFRFVICNFQIETIIPPLRSRFRSDVELLDGPSRDLRVADRQVADRKRQRRDVFALPIRDHEALQGKTRRWSREFQDDLSNC
jgi:hypothetical protein